MDDKNPKKKNEEPPKEASLKPKPGPVIKKIVSQRKLAQIAVIAAKTQGVKLQDARAPKSIMTAVRELNQLAVLAARILAGQKKAETLFRERLAGIAVGSSGNLGGGASSGASGLNLIGDATRGKLPCAESIGGALQVLGAAASIAFREKTRSAKLIGQARTYVRERMTAVDRFGASGALPPDSVGGDIPAEEKLAFILQQQEYIYPTPDPYGPGGFDEDLCNEQARLCMSEYEAALTATLNDPFMDLIGSVEPNCLCSNYDPSQIFVARPAPLLSFQVTQGTLPTDVKLFFHGADITGDIIPPVTPDALRFRIPPNSQTGFVYLRGMFAAGGPTISNETLNRLCAGTLPPLPEILIPGQGPTVVISIIDRPVIDSFTVNGNRGPEIEVEACSPVQVCWHAHLRDQTRNQLLPPCGSISVVVRDREGTFVAQGGAQGCVTINSPIDQVLTAEARSLASNQPCGTSEPVKITVKRIRRLHLLRDVPQGSEILAGSNGSLFVDMLCPAPAKGLEVRLLSSNSQNFQLPASVTIPAGATRARVVFKTPPQACGEVEVRATAAGHAEARLRYDLIRAPVISWAITEYVSGPPPPRTAAFTSFTFSVNVDCLPPSESRLAWKLVRTDAGGQGQELSVRVTRPSLGTFFLVTPTNAALAGLTLGTWAIVAEIPDLGLVSNRLVFEVDRCLVDVRLDSVTVIEGQGDLEGDLELSVMSFATSNPPPIRSIGDFTPAFQSARWPPSHVAQSRDVPRHVPVFPLVRIGTFGASRTRPGLVDVRALVTDYDDWFQLSSDAGTNSGQLVVDCNQETTLVLDVIIFGDVFHSPINPVTIIDFDNLIHPVSREADGLVRLVYKATPRSGP